MENIDLTLLQASIQKAGRDAEAAYAATDRLSGSILPRITALESRFAALEQRFSGLEATGDQLNRNMNRGLDALTQSNARLLQTLSDILAKLP